MTPRTPVVVIGSSPWHSQWRRRQHLYSHLARFREVYHLDPPFPVLDFWRRVAPRHARAAGGEIDRGCPDGGHAREWSCPPPRAGISLGVWRRSAGRVELDSSGVRVVRGCPGFPAERYSPEARRMNAWLQRRQVHALLAHWRKSGLVTHPILVCYDALLHPLEPQADWAQLVFDVVDDYPARTSFHRFGRMLAEKTHALASASDLVIVTSDALRARLASSAASDRVGGIGRSHACRLGDRVKLLPHGVDPARFHPDAWMGTAFETWKRTPGPKAVFHGTLDHKIDLETLRALLRAGVTLLLAGEMSWSTDTLAQLRTLGGAHYFGSLPLADAAALVAAGDVGILPYLPFAGHEGATILKHLEFLAAGLPVVGSDLPACRRCGEGIKVARDPESFAASVKAAFHEANDSAFSIARNRRIEIARENSWEARAAELDRWLAP
ncbi:MAG: glycosyltransferase [Candidatus Eisenbacteria bacterium]|nr:glycosyltransferase [Candidatus Eisenbacteria bacterium]